jgi:O-antigen/teichoic acid export membrane protein
MAMEEDLSSQATGRGVLLLASKDIVSSVAAVGFFILLARFLPTVSDLGVLTGLQTIIIMFVIFSGLGLPFTAIRFISTYVGSGSKERAFALYPLIFALSVGFSAILSGLLFHMSFELSIIFFHTPAVTGLIQLTSLEVFILSLVTTCIFLLSASMEFKRVTKVSISTSVLKYSISFVLLILGMDLYGIILGFIIGDSIALAALIYSLRTKLLRGIKNIGSTLSEVKSLLGFTMPLYGFEILSFLSFRIDVYLLMALSTTYMVGLYSPALFIDGIFLILLTALDQALLPQTSRRFGKTGLASFKHSSRYITRCIFLIFFPFGFLVAASIPSLIILTLGERFVDSVVPIIILILSITLTSPVVIAYNLLRSAGYTKILLKSSAISLGTQITISTFAIPQMGVLGVAVSRISSRFILMVLLLSALNKIGVFQIDRKALRNGLGASVLVSTVIAILSIIIVLPYFIFVECVLGVVSIFIFYRLTSAMNEADLELIDKMLKGKARWLTRAIRWLILK